MVLVNVKLSSKYVYAHGLGLVHPQLERLLQRAAVNVETPNGWKS